MRVFKGLLMVLSAMVILGNVYTAYYNFVVTEDKILGLLAVLLIVYFMTLIRKIYNTNI